MRTYFLKTFAKALIDSILYAVIILLLILHNGFEFAGNVLLLIGIGIFVRIISRIIFKIYQDLSPFSGVIMIFKMGITTTIGYIIQLIFAYFVFKDTELIKISSLTIFPFLILTETFLLVVYRYWRRILNSFLQFNRNINKTLIIGAGDGAKIVVDEISNNKKMNNYIVGFIDDDDKKIGRFFRGKRILGTSNDVEKIIKQFEIQEIIISTIKYPEKKFEQIINIADKIGRAHV